MNSIRHRHPLRLIAIAWIAALMLSPFAAHAADSTDRGPMDLESIAVLDLETAVRIALEGNPTLDIAKARVEQARQAIEQSKSAYWPRLDASASGFGWPFRIPLWRLSGSCSRRSTVPVPRWMIQRWFIPPV
jgi:outer membrane protein TolC